MRVISVVTLGSNIIVVMVFIISSSIIIFTVNAIILYNLWCSKVCSLHYNVSPQLHIIAHVTYSRIIDFIKTFINNTTKLIVNGHIAE